MAKSKKFNILKSRSGGTSPVRYKDISSDSGRGKSSRSGRKKWSRKKKALVISLSSVGAILAICVSLFFYMFGGLSMNSISKDLVDLGIDAMTAEKYKNSGITNIALFGIDPTSATSNTGRSDSIMIVSINRKTGEIKMTSILRDSKVAIDGHGEEKITHAYAYGGPQLAIKTLNQNFNLDIKDYVTVNFAQLTSIINALGGIDLEITGAEANQINSMVKGSNMSAGKVHLNGEQATAYSRIRKIDSDSVRADRQKKVMECMLAKVKQKNVLEYPALISNMMSMCETSLNYGDLMGYVPLLSGDLSIIQNTVPNKEDNAVGGGNPWVWVYDLSAATNRLHNFIYGEEQNPS